jgi:hypothetical protein
MTEDRKNIWNSHSLWMVLCCGIPLVAIVILSSFGVLGEWGLYALILLCPLLHFLFMRRMASKNQGDAGSPKDHLVRGK